MIGRAAIALLGIIIGISIVHVLFLSAFTESSVKSKKVPEDFRDDCDKVHLAVLCCGSEALVQAVTLLKSILFRRSSAIHVYWITDSFTAPIISVLMDSWRIPYFESTVHIADNFFNQTSFLNTSHYAGHVSFLKLFLPDILHSVERVIVLDTDVVLLDDIQALWTLFGSLSYHAIVGIVENLSGRRLRNYMYAFAYIYASACLAKSEH